MVQAIKPSVVRGRTGHVWQQRVGQVRDQDAAALAAELAAEAAVLEGAGPADPGAGDGEGVADD